MRILVRTLLLILMGSVGSAQTPVSTSGTTTLIQVVDGKVMPRRPLRESVADAIQFLRKADGGYRPGSLEGDLAGYFTSAHVNEDGSRTTRTLAFPARQHAYFIFTFLGYGRYSGESEWLARARDLADWNLAHSTPPGGAYPNLPYSTWSNGKPGGSKDVDSIEPDKAAFLGSAYLALHGATSSTKYLNGAREIAKSLVKRQKEDGSWPFRVHPVSGEVRQEFGGAPVFFVEFFEDLLRREDEPSYRAAHAKALALMLRRHVTNGLWGTYHEDIVSKPNGYLSAEPMSFTASYLFRHSKEHPEYVEMGRQILRRMEERLVHTEGHPAAPAPAVSEQAGFDHLMPGHTARYCLALLNLYKASGDQEARTKALSGINALTYMQSDAGLFRTFFQSVRKQKDTRTRPNWYSQHLYTVCHLLEAQLLEPAILAVEGEKQARP